MLRHYSKFGTLLRRARNKRGLTRDDVARKLGGWRDTYARMDRGEVLPSLRAFDALRRILAIDNVHAYIEAIPARVAPPRATRHHHPWGAPSRRAPHGAFAMVLRRVRGVRALGQRDVARSVGCAVATYTNIESGAVLPSLTLFAKLYRCLQFDAAELLDALDQKPPSAPYYELGALLCQARHRRALSPEDLADAIGCPPSDYQRIEDGHALPTLETLVHLHKVLGFVPGSALHAVRRSLTWQNQHAHGEE